MSADPTAKFGIPASPVSARLLGIANETDSADLARARAAFDAGRFEEAETLCRQQLQVLPNLPDAVFLLGASQVHLGRPHEAVATLSRAIALAPARPEAHYFIAMAFRNVGVLNAAAAGFRQAKALKADFFGAQFALVDTLMRAGDFKAADQAAREAIRMQPQHFPVRFMLGDALRLAGRLPEAAEAYREALAVDRTMGGVNFWIAACGAAPQPTRAPNEVLMDLFDDYARFYDNHMQQLKYDLPQQLADLLGGARLAPGIVIDVGCGTGLCALVLRPFATELHGVDVSQRMVAAAQAKAVYDSVSAMDLFDYLPMRRGAYDLIVAASVLPYAGDLAALLVAAVDALKPGGHAAISTEAVAPDDAGLLRPDGHYSHGDAHFKAAAKAAGFAPVAQRAVSFAQDRGAPLAGSLYLLRRT